MYLNMSLNHLFFVTLDSVLHDCRMLFLNGQCTHWKLGVWHLLM